jgi:hypothetical protein
MGYVALSRVRDLRSLTLGGLNKVAITMNSRAAQIDGLLRQKSADDALRFAHLVDVWKKQSMIKPTRKTGGQWDAKLAKMREKFPNAYRPWKELDDLRLVQLSTQHKDVDELSKIFGRHPGSIIKRLEKLAAQHVTDT